MVELVKESEETQLETIEPSEVAPLSEVLGEVATEEEKKSLPDWSPVKSPKIMAHLDRLASALFGLKGVEAYKNESASSTYIGFRVAPRRGICFIYLSEKSARVSLGEAIKENGRTRGEFSKHLIYRAEESGFTRDGEKVKTKEITALVKVYVKARGWA